MSEAEWAATERARQEMEMVERVLDRITVKRRVYRPTPEKARRRRVHTPALARQWRWMMRLAWLDERCGRSRGGWVCGAMIDLLWRRLDR